MWNEEKLPVIQYEFGIFLFSVPTKRPATPASTPTAGPTTEMKTTAPATTPAEGRSI